MSQYLTVDERVAAGVALLDRVAPDWFERIDLYDLDMSESGYCVLGQVFGGYSESVAELSGLNEGLPDMTVWHARDAWSIAHGFEVYPTSSSQSAYDRLGLAWREIIEERLMERESRGAPLN